MSTEPLSEAVAAKALDGLSMRMAAIAQNLANAATPRYQPIGVDFEQALRSAAQRGPQAVENLEFAFTAGRSYRQGEDRRIDLMLADASTTAARYAALVDMLGRRMSLREEAIGGQG